MKTRLNMTTLTLEGLCTTYCRTIRIDLIPRPIKIRSTLHSGKISKLSRVWSKCWACQQQQISRLSQLTLKMWRNCLHKLTLTWINLFRSAISKRRWVVKYSKSIGLKTVCKYYLAIILRCSAKIKSEKKSPILRKSSWTRLETKKSSKLNVLSLTNVGLMVMCQTSISTWQTASH